MFYYLGIYAKNLTKVITIRSQSHVNITKLVLKSFFYIYVKKIDLRFAKIKHNII